jgi:hypothetical protein
VDLVCTRTNPANATQTIADTFLENVLVLAVNAMATTNSAQETAKGGNIATPSVVTLAAKPIDAARIIWAKEKGSITLILRRPGEDEEGRVPQVTELNTVGDGPGGRGKPSQLVKVWVARDNVFPGMVEKPEQIFELLDVPPTMAGDAFKGPNPPPAARLYSVVAKGMPVTSLHYKISGGPDPSLPAPRDKPYIMTVRVGGKDPQYYRFSQDGQLLDDGKPADGPGGAPQGGSEGAGEIK